MSVLQHQISDKWPLRVRMKNALSLINMVKARLREIAPLSQRAGFTQPNPHLLSRGTFLLKTSTTSTDNDVFYFKKKFFTFSFFRYEWPSHVSDFQNKLWTLSSRSISKDAGIQEKEPRDPRKAGRHDVQRRRRRRPQPVRIIRGHSPIPRQWNFFAILLVGGVRERERGGKKLPILNIDSILGAFHDWCDR